MRDYEVLPYIGDRTKELKGEDFFELIEYASMKKMCMTYGCTTCGCMQFRDLCRYTIGRDNMVAMIEAVTEDDLKKHEYQDWFSAVGIICVVFNDLPRDCFLMEEYRATREAYYRSREKAYEENLLKMQRIKEEKAAQRAVISRAHIERAAAKNRMLPIFIESMTSGKMKDVPDEDGNVRKTRVMTPFGRLRVTPGQKEEYVANKDAIDAEIVACIAEHGKE